MEKNIEILKGIEFDNLNEEGLKQLLVSKFAKNINKGIVPGESYIPVSGKVIDEEDVLWGIESMMDAWLTAGRFSVKLERELARYFGSRFSLLVNSGSSANLVAFYGYYVLNESFMYFSEQAATEEDDFYKFYKNKAGTLLGYQKEQFIINTLKLMKLARTNRSLEKQLFLRELTKTEIHGISTNYENASFNKIDQFSTAKNEVDYYLVEYQFVERVSDIKTELRKYVLKFDPYLVLISKEKM